jgi:hypothetical protein
VGVRDDEKLPTCEAEWFGQLVESVGGDFYTENTDDDGICP